MAKYRNMWVLHHCGAFFAIHIALTYPEGSVSLLELFGFDMFSGFAIVFFFAFWNELLQSYKLNPA